MNATEYTKFINKKQAMKSAKHSNTRVLQRTLVNIGNFKLYEFFYRIETLQVRLCCHASWERVSTTLQNFTSLMLSKITKTSEADAEIYCQSYGLECPYLQLFLSQSCGRTWNN